VSIAIPSSVAISAVVYPLARRRSVSYCLGVRCGRGSVGCGDATVRAKAEDADDPTAALQGDAVRDDACPRSVRPKYDELSVDGAFGAEQLARKRSLRLLTCSGARTLMK
jgi:hypothetical protein